MNQNNLPFCSNLCTSDDCSEDHDVDCECAECHDEMELAWLEREEALATGN